MRKAVTLALLVTPLGLAPVASAQAQDGAPQLELEVVQASNKGGQVDSQFSGLKRRFAHSGFSYSSYRQVASHVGELRAGQPLELKLAHDGTVRVKLMSAAGATPYQLHLTAPGGHDLDIAAACGATGVLELEHNPANPDSGSAMLLRYHLRCEAKAPAAPGPDAGS